MQVLTGFLLAVPFTDRFDQLDHVQRTAYLIVLSGAVSATMAVLAPIAYHRILFRRDRRPWLVESANRIARVGLVLAALTMCGVVFLAFDLTAGRAAGIVASAGGVPHVRRALGGRAAARAPTRGLALTRTRQDDRAPTGDRSGPCLWGATGQSRTPETLSICLYLLPVYSRMPIVALSGYRSC